MKQDIVTPEWLSQVFLELDGTETSVTEDRVKRNHIIQNTSNKYYGRLRRAMMADERYDNDGS